MNNDHINSFLRFIEGQEICSKCNGSGKEKITFNYDNSDKRTACYNMLKQIDLLTKGSVCLECNGEGEIELFLLPYQKEKIKENKKLWLSTIYESGPPLIKSLINIDIYKKGN